jgi:hypothetical protein
MRETIVCKPIEATGRSVVPDPCEEKGGVTTAAAVQSSADALAGALACSGVESFP